MLENLEGDIALARKSVCAFIEAAATANPSGKQNTFAAYNPPDLVLVEMRGRNIPLSYANAFIKPCFPKQEKSLMDVSVAATADYMGRIDQTYSLNGDRLHIDTGPYHLPASHRAALLKELLGTIHGRLA